MATNAAAPSDGAPGSVHPALIKMSNQHTKLSQASTKLNEQDNMHAVPVCALMAPAQPYAATCLGRGVAPRAMLGSCSRRLPVTRETSALLSWG